MLNLLNPTSNPIMEAQDFNTLLTSLDRLKTEFSSLCSLPFLEDTFSFPTTFSKYLDILSTFHDQIKNAENIEEKSSISQEYEQHIRSLSQEFDNVKTKMFEDYKAPIFEIMDDDKIDVFDDCDLVSSDINLAEYRNCLRIETLFHNKHDTLPLNIIEKLKDPIKIVVSLSTIHRLFEFLNKFYTKLNKAKSVASIDEIMSELKEKTNRILELEAQIQHNSIQFQSKERQITNLKTEKESLEKANLEYQNRIAKSEKKISKQSQEMNQIQEENQELREILQSIAESTAAQQNLENDIKVRDEKIKQLETTILDMQNRYRDVLLQIQQDLKP